MGVFSTIWGICFELGGWRATWRSGQNRFSTDFRNKMKNIVGHIAFFKYFNYFQRFSLLTMSSLYSKHIYIYICIYEWSQTYISSYFDFKYFICWRETVNKLVSPRRELTLPLTFRISGGGVNFLIVFNHYIIIKNCSTK